MVGRASSFAIAIIEKRGLAAACLIESSLGVLEVQSKTHAKAAQGMNPKLLLAMATLYCQLAFKATYD